VSLPAGTYGIRFIADAASGNLNNIDWFQFVSGAISSPTNTATQTPTITFTPGGVGIPFNGTPYTLPGTVEAENFNIGGEGVAYHDTDASNNGGQYRPNEGVDIEATSDTGGGFDVGWAGNGEWMNYTVNVTASGVYDINFRIASAQTGTFHLEVDGTDVTGPMAYVNTGGWQNWTTVTRSGVALTAGQHVLRFFDDVAGGNLNWFSVVASSGPTDTATPTATSGATNTPTATLGGTVAQLYLLSGGTLSVNPGSGAVSDPIASAGGSNFDGTPNNPTVYTITHVNGTYAAGQATHFSLYVDAGTTVGNGTQVRVSYDFTGSGTFSRVETYHYFATDPVVGWETYTDAVGTSATSGAFSDMTDGMIKVEVWNAIGNGPSTLQASATGAQGQQSALTVPFILAVAPTATNTITPTNTVTNTATSTATFTATATNTATVTPSLTPTYTATSTATPTNTVTPTVTPTSTRVPVGPDTIGLYNVTTSTFYLRTTNTTGKANITVQFGTGGKGWLPITGDWTGTGTTKIGLYNPATSTFYLKNTLTGGAPDTIFQFGTAGQGWLPIAGDWTGSGTTKIGLYNPATSTFYLKNALTSGPADTVIQFGMAGQGLKPVTGDWTGTGVTKIGLYDRLTGTFYLKNTLTGGAPDTVFQFGLRGIGFIPVTGDWDGNHTTTIGLYWKLAQFFLLRNSNTRGTPDIFARIETTRGDWIPVTGHWVSPVSAPHNTAPTFVPPVKR
jgi:hypothetical protein